MAETMPGDAARQAVPGHADAHAALDDGVRHFQVADPEGGQGRRGPLHEGLEGGLAQGLGEPAAEIGKELRGLGPEHGRGAELQPPGPEGHELPALLGVAAHGRQARQRGGLDHPQQPVLEPHALGGQEGAGALRLGAGRLVAVADDHHPGQAPGLDGLQALRHQVRFVDEIGSQVLGGRVQPGRKIAQHAAQVQGHLAAPGPAGLGQALAELVHVREGRHADHAQAAGPREARGQGVAREGMPALHEYLGLGPERLLVMRAGHGNPPVARERPRGIEINTNAPARILS